MKHGKRYNKSAENVDRQQMYDIDEAVQKVKENATAKFDESIELHMRLGVDSRHADQQVRGAMVLPNGTGKDVKVAVIGNSEQIKEAQEAGADFAGEDDLIDKIQKENWMDFDVLITAPNMMGKVGRLGRILGPRGLMPNPKSGTVTQNIAEAVKETKAGKVGRLGRILGPRGLMPNPKSGTVTQNIAEAVKETKAGKVEYRLDKTNIIHMNIGKASFDDEKLKENLEAVIDTIKRAKPQAAKGQYLRSVTLTSTMGPGIKLNPNRL